LSQNRITIKIAATTHDMALGNIDVSGDHVPYLNLIYPDALYQHSYSIGQIIDYNSLN